MDSKAVHKALLWASLVSPFIFSTARTTSDITSSGLGALDILRGGGAIILPIIVGYFRPQLLRLVRPEDLFLAAFLAICVLSTLWSVDPRATLLKGLTLTANYVAIVMLSTLYSSAKQMFDAIAGFSYLVVLCAFASLLVVPSAALAVDDTSNIPRLSSVIPQVGANPLAYVAVTSAAAVMLEIGPRWSTLPFWRGTLFVLSLAALLLTRTRIGIAVGGVLLALALLASIKRRPVSVIILSTLSVSAIALIGSYSSWLTSFFTRGQSGHALETLTGRTEIWEIAGKSVLLHPYFGLGYFSGHRLGLEGLPGGGTQSNIDNTWLELAVDVGFVGAFLIAAFIIVRLVLLAIAADLGKTYKMWGLLVVVYGIVISLVNPTVQNPGVGLILIILTLYHPPKNVRSEPESAGSLSTAPIMLQRNSI